jgi:type IV secretion system protein TrbL
MAGLGGIGSCISDPLSCPGQVVGGVASDAASSGLKALADGAFDFLGSVLKLLTTFWISAPRPDLTSPQSAVRLLQDQLRPVACFALVVGLLAASARLLWNARAGEPGVFSQAFKGILLTVVVSGSGALIISVLMSAFDQWADHILSTGFDGVGVGKRVGELASAGGAVGQLGSLFAVVLFGLAALASLVQFALMLVRAPIVVLLCVHGRLPLRPPSPRKAPKPFGG